ncbi:MAG: enoyl-CoA hydratase/isomerase family protein, partial [Nitrospinota bacterium]|nr:enoyl-CoA hydratase/isomerase family protein [Nitrospinota bacterium]
MSHVEVEISGRVAYVTLNRPEVLNAYNREMVAQLIEAFRRLSGEDDVWAAVLRSAGRRAFSVGADLKERKTLPMKEVRRLRATLEEAHDLVTFFP